MPRSAIEPSPEDDRVYRLVSTARTEVDRFGVSIMISVLHGEPHGLRGPASAGGQRQRNPSAVFLSLRLFSGCRPRHSVLIFFRPACECQEVVFLSLSQDLLRSPSLWSKTRQDRWIRSAHAGQGGKNYFDLCMNLDPASRGMRERGRAKQSPAQEKAPPGILSSHSLFATVVMHVHCVRVLGRRGDIRRRSN